MTEEEKREIENMLNKYSRRQAYAEEELDEDMRCLYESKINDIFEIIKIMGHEVKCAGMVKLPNKEYKYFLCPNCKQMVRVPRGKGNIEIKCPKCQHKFDRKS